MTPTPPAGSASTPETPAVAGVSPAPESPPYWLGYSGRLVRYASLDRSTRLLAMVGSVAAVAGLGVLTLPLARLPAVAMPAALSVLHVPWPVLAVAALLQAGGWWYLVGGAALGGARVRLPVAAAFMALVLTGVVADMPVAIAAGALAAFLVLTAWRPLPARWAVPIAGAGVGLVFALMLRQGAALFALTLLNETAISYLLVVPVIFYSGYDLGQTALHGVRLALGRLHGRLGLPALTVLVVLVLVAKGVLLVTVEHGPSPSFVLAVVVLAAALVASRRLDPEEEHPPEHLPALAALLVVGAVFGPGALGRVWADAAALALAAGAVLAVRAWRLGARAQAAVYLIVFGLWNLANVITMPSGGVGGWLALLARFPWPIDARGLDQAVLLAGLAYFAWLLLYRAMTQARLYLLLFWLVGMSLVLGLWNVLSGLETLSHGALGAETVLLAIGIGHEVAASGGLLNRGSPAVPRPSRVLLYLGYLLIVCGSTVIADGSAGPMAGTIRSDTLQQGGLILIGIPLYLQMFAHALAVGRPPATYVQAGGGASATDAPPAAVGTVSG